MARQKIPGRQTVIEKSETVAVAGTGAGGGNQFSSNCPAVSVMVGLNLRTGPDVDSIQGVCVKVNPDGSWMRRSRAMRGQDIHLISRGNRAGGNGAHRPL